MPLLRAGFCRLPLLLLLYQLSRDGLELGILRRVGGLTVVEDVVEFALDGAVASGDGLDHWLEVVEIVEFVIQEMRAGDIGHRGEHRLANVGRLQLEFGDEAFDAGTLEVRLRTAQIARDYREFLLLAVREDLAFLTVRERANDRVAAVIATQDRRHRLELADVEEVHQKRRDHVVSMMAERDLGAFFLDSDVVQDAATKTAAERTIRVAFGNVCGHDRVSVFFDDAVRHIARLQIFGQHVFGKIGLLLVEIHSQDVEFDGRAALDIEQQIEQRVAVFAARETDHDAVAILDHREIFDRTTHLFEQLGLEFCLSSHTQIRRSAENIRVCHVIPMRAMLKTLDTHRRCHL